MAEPEDREQSLAVREDDRPTAVDAYERRYMKGEGMVLYRDKQRAPWIMTALIGTAALGTLLPALLGPPGAWVSALVGLPILLVTWVLFSVLRVTVSQGSVHVQYGLFGPKIPIAAIEAVGPTEYKWTTFGGWGIRRGPGGAWLYNMPGDEGRAVRIEWRDAKGRRRTTLVGSKHSLELAKTIEKARRALPAAASAAALPAGDDDPS